MDTYKSTSEILIKNSGAINIANQLTSTQRKCWNTMLYYAYPKLQLQDQYEESLSSIRFYTGYKNRNIEDFKNLIREMQGLTVEGDLLKKVDEDWRSVQLLGDVAFTKDGQIRWSYSKHLRNFLSSPAIYAKLNMIVQKELSGKYTVPLWECFIDQLGAKRPQALIKIPLGILRKILPVGEGKYEAFKDFKRYVVVPAVEEINRYGDIHIKETNYIRTGRRVSRIDFLVERKKKISDILSTYDYINPDEVRTESEVLEKLIAHISVQFQLTDKQSMEVKKLLEKEGDPQNYLRGSANYVKQKYANGGIEKSIGGYFIGVLRNGYNKNLSEQSTEAITKKHSDEKLTLLERKLHSGKTAFMHLNQNEKEQTLNDFRDSLSLSFRILFDTTQDMENEKELYERLYMFMHKKIS